MKVTKAVIVAAGWGTRMLPASKVVPKELLPVVDVPAIQLVVEEVAACGIRDVIVVVAPGRSQVLDHFRAAPELERYLAERGKRDLLKLVRRPAELANVRSVLQEKALGLGHAVLQAREAAGDEPFALLLPDDIFAAPRPCLAQILETAQQKGAPAVALTRVARSEVSKYGIVRAEPAGPRTYRLSGMVEKPEPETAPSDLAIVGRYILPPEIFPLLADVRPGAGGEIQLTDALARLSATRPVYGCQFEGERFDVGDRLGFLRAQIAFALRRPELAEGLRGMLRSFISS